MHLKEIGGDAMRARSDEASARRQIQAFFGSLFGHAWIDIQQRQPFAVDRNLELLVRNIAEKRSFGIAVQQRAEVVLAVGREVEHDRYAAAGTEWRPGHLP